MPRVFTIAGTGPLCEVCWHTVEVDLLSREEKRILVRCSRCGWTGQIDPVFFDIQPVATLPDGKSHA